MEKTTGVFMIATVIALLIGAIIGIGTLVLFAMLLAHVQNVDNPLDWRNSSPTILWVKSLPISPKRRKSRLIPNNLAIPKEVKVNGAALEVDDVHGFRAAPP
jgi:uncharacterized membrane protein required for colicin V production